MLSWPEAIPKSKLPVRTNDVFVTPLESSSPYNLCTHDTLMTFMVQTETKSTSLIASPFPISIQITFENIGNYIILTILILPRKQSRRNNKPDIVNMVNIKVVSWAWVCPIICNYLTITTFLISAYIPCTTIATMNLQLFSMLRHTSFGTISKVINYTF